MKISADISDDESNIPNPVPETTGRGAKRKVRTFPKQMPRIKSEKLNKTSKGQTQKPLPRRLVLSMEVGKSSRDHGDSPVQEMSWYNKMKAELKKEVTEEVLVSLSKTEDLKSDKGGATAANDLSRTVHLGVYCDGCDNEIRGIRYKCGNCEDYDLCEKCENGDIQKTHDVNHIFLKIRVPCCLMPMSGLASKVILANKPGTIAKSVAVPQATKEKDQLIECFKSKFVCDETVPDGMVVFPGMKFTKTWRVCNSGTSPWTEETVVKEEKKKRRETRKKDVKQIADVLNAVVHEDQGSHHRKLGQRKPMVTSQTATPNNTPFDLTPPKSPEPQELVDVKSNVPVSCLEKGMADDKANTSDVDDKASITTLSSSESDSEFVVIPMPQCFSLLESYSSQTSHVSSALKASTYTSDSEKEDDSDIVIIEENLLPSFDSLHLNETKAASLPVIESPKEENTVAEPPRKTVLSWNGSQPMPIDLLDDKDLIVVNMPTQNSARSVCSDDFGSSSSDLAASVFREQQNEEQNNLQQTPAMGTSVDNPQENSETSCTFPKFPLNIESEEPAQPSFENTTLSPSSQRTIQVLPDGLVTGALIAAASVYNTAKAALRTFQPRSRSGSDEDGAAEQQPSQTAMEQLEDMGFFNRELNSQLLSRYSNNLPRVITELINHSDREWINMCQNQDNGTAKSPQ